MDLDPILADVSEEAAEMARKRREVAQELRRRLIRRAAYYIMLAAELDQIYPDKQE